MKNKHKYKAIDIANYIVEYANKINKPITNLQLQKILYYVQVEEVSFIGDVLFDDDIVAWKYGPVIEDVYYILMGFGSNSINSRCLKPISKDLEESVKLRINKIIDDKLNKSGWRLSKEVCLEYPWLKATNNGENLGVIISVDLLKNKNYA